MAGWAGDSSITASMRGEQDGPWDSSWGQPRVHIPWEAGGDEAGLRLGSGLGTVAGSDTAWGPPGGSTVTRQVQGLSGKSVHGLGSGSTGPWPHRWQSCGGVGDQCSSSIARAGTDGLSMNGLLEACHWRPPVKLKMREDEVVKAGGAFQ